MRDCRKYQERIEILVTLFVVSSIGFGLGVLLAKVVMWLIGR